MNPDMLEAGPADAKVLSVFDFDGTLTHHDSFVPFLKFAFGTGEFYGRMVKLAVPGLRFLVRQISRDELKAQLIRTFMTGVEKTWVQQKAEEYCQRNWARLMRPASSRVAPLQLQIANPIQYLLRVKRINRRQTSS